MSADDDLPQAAEPTPPLAAAAPPSVAPQEKERRFSWTIKALTVFGRAVLRHKPWAAPFGTSDSVFDAIHKDVMDELGRPTVAPARVTLPKKYRDTLKQFKKDDAQEFSRSGTAAEYDEFKKLWTQTLAEKTAQDAGDARDAKNSEEEKRQRAQNIAVVSQVQEAILLSRKQRKTGEQAAVANPVATAAPSVATTTDAGDSDDEDEARKLLQAGKTPPQPSKPDEPLSFTRPRDADGNGTRRSKSSTDLEEAVLEDLASRRKEREAASRRVDEELELRRKELEIAEMKARNE